MYTAEDYREIERQRTQRAEESRQVERDSYYYSHTDNSTEQRYGVTIYRR